MRNDLTYRGVTYDDDAVRGVSAAIDTSLNGRSLDVDTMQAVVQSSDESLTQISQEYPVAFLRGGSQYSLHYMESVEHVGEDFYQLNLTSPLGRLLQMPHRGGIYAARSAGSLIREICGYVNGQPTAGVTVYIAPAFEDIPLYGWLPNVSPAGENGAKQESAKDNFMRVLVAINATVRDDAVGTLRVENLSTAVSSIIDSDRVFRGTTRVVHELPVTSVTVLEHQYIAGSKLTTLFEGTTLDNQVITFDEPMSDLEATGFTIEESNANYAIVSAGSGALTGRAYIHTTREITAAVSEAAIPNPVRIETATLVSLTNSGEVVRRLVDYYRHRTWICCEASIKFEDAGDVVSVWDTMSKTMRQACIEKISPLRASNIMRGTISALIGFTPWQEVPFEDVRELLTGCGTWTVPEGVTEVTAVLIDRGSDGSDGEDGEAAVRESVSVTKNSSPWLSYGQSSSLSASTSTPAISGCAGGPGGVGGEGGKILRVQIAVSPGDVISFGCAADENGHTFFAEYSAEDGSSSESGYTDPVTQQIFGKKGATGESGASGGSSGKDGENTSLSEGGHGVESRAASPSTTYRLNYYDELTTNMTLFGAGGGGAGGASGEAKGEPGADAAQQSPGYSMQTYDGNTEVYGHVSCAGAVPGKGGDGADGADGQNYGDGGAGGGGGGGAGGLGRGSVSATLKATYLVQSGTGTRPFRLVVRCNGTNSSRITVGIGGKGGKGGRAKSGCIILYYRKPIAA